MSNYGSSAGASAEAFAPATSVAEVDAPEAPAPAAESPDIATKAELDHLIETRPSPTTELHLTPNGWEAGEVNRQVAVSHENRIVDLNDRLQRTRETLERDHAFARLEGLARVDFERSR